ncbi:MAG: hypothetical protein IT431_17300 [Phycisphaerales bacterium]|nr:hypothetical protein [Phycisphaerales bacterium]
MSPRVCTSKYRLSHTRFAVNEDCMMTCRNMIVDQIKERPSNYFMGDRL